jgi:hypothetical protein
MKNAESMFLNSGREILLWSKVIASAPKVSEKK